MEQLIPGAPSAWLAYVHVDGLEEAMSWRNCDKRCNGVEGQHHHRSDWRSPSPVEPKKPCYRMHGRFVVNRLR
jgi:hypothetical protein